MSGRISKIVKFYNNKQSKTPIGELVFDQINVPLTVDVPDGCEYFECFSEITDELCFNKKMLDLVSEKLNLKGYDFSLAEQNELPREVYVAVCLKSLPSYEVYAADEVSTVHNIGYGNITHADFSGEFDHVQHPKSLSFKYVRVPSTCNRFELFDTVSQTFATNRGDVKLTCPQKLNHSTFYVGYLQEVKGDTRTVLATAQDGQRIVCQLGELISPEMIDYNGRIIQEPATPEI